jgi:hypothetical protein
VTHKAHRRPPVPEDIALLAKALGENEVEYVMIGGAAMLLHGFPRMTRDIDLFLPVDPKNNRRLLHALKALPNSRAALAELRPKYLDEGFSTSVEGEIAVDLLYVAAGKKYSDLRSHVQHINFEGVSVATLDVDGMLISKNTPRESDIPDRIKLEKLRNAIFDAEMHRRRDAVVSLHGHASGAVRLFAAMAKLAMESATDSPVNWKRVEDQVLAAAGQDSSMDIHEVVDALCRYSPGAVSPGRQAKLRKLANRTARP